MSSQIIIRLAAGVVVYKHSYLYKTRGCATHLSEDRQAHAEPPTPHRTDPAYREALFHQVDIKGVRVVEVEEAFLRQQLLLVRQVTVEGILDQDVIISIIYYYYIGKIHICDTYVNDRYLIIIILVIIAITIQLPLLKATVFRKIVYLKGIQTSSFPALGYNWLYKQWPANTLYLIENVL